jgi:regulator of RNase E activity RraA
MALSAKSKELLGSASTATIQTQLFIRGFRNQFLNGVILRTPSHKNFVGEAFTLRNIPAREDLDKVEAFKDPKHPQRFAVESIGSGQVMVVDSRGDGRAASAGEILITRIAKRGGVGFITDGSVRDSFEMDSIGIPVYTAGVSANTNLIHHHAVDFQVPIGCAGVAVFPGDILVGDQEGVLVIPHEIADEVAVAAAEQHLIEDFILMKVRQGAKLPGTYPPSPELIEEFKKTTRESGK